MISQSAKSERSLGVLTGRKAGFTLIELMVVIMIIAIMMTVLALALAGVAEHARGERTKALIVKLDTLLMNRWKSFETRRVPIDTVGMSPSQAAELRLSTIRELMRLEMPDRFVDIKTPPQGPLSNVYSSGTGPAAWMAYRLRIGEEGSGIPKPNTDFQNAECLYLILTTPMGGEESALGQFNENEIGDVDQDGAPEFIDGWGNPIRFLRWAPGFVDQEIEGKFEYISDMQKPDPGNSHDPFDPLSVDIDAYALYPLIYSAGPDEIPDIAISAKAGGPSFPSDPFSQDWLKVGRPTDGDTFSQGAKNGELNHRDNIHNHSIGTN